MAVKTVKLKIMTLSLICGEKMKKSIKAGSAWKELSLFFYVTMIFYSFDKRQIC